MNLRNYITPKAKVFNVNQVVIQLVFKQFLKFKMNN